MSIIGPYAQAVAQAAASVLQKMPRRGHQIGSGHRTLDALHKGVHPMTEAERAYIANHPLERGRRTIQIGTGSLRRQNGYVGR